MFHCRSCDNVYLYSARVLPRAEKSVNGIYTDGHKLLYTLF